MRSLSPIVLAALLAGCGLSNPPTGTASSQAREATESFLVELREATGPNFEVQLAPSGLPRGMMLDHPVDPSVDGLRELLFAWSELFRLDTVDGLELWVMREVRDEERGGLHVTFGLQVDGVVVEDAEITLHVLEDRLLALDARYDLEIGPVDAGPIGPRDARGHALSWASGTFEHANATGEPVELLVGRHRTWRWAMQVVLDGGEAATAVVYVDQHTGAIVRHHLIREDHLDYEIRDGNNGNRTLANGSPNCFPNAVVQCDENGCIQNATADATSLDTEFAGFEDWLGRVYLREGPNGDDSRFDGVTDVFMPNNWGAGTSNANYNRACDLTRYSPGMATDDVVAHELGHQMLHKMGVHSNSTNAGAVHEHFGDMQAWQYQQDATGAYDYDLDGVNVIRDMTAWPVPHHTSQVTTNHGVHDRSQVLSAAAMLMLEGGTHPVTGQDVEPVDPEAFRVTHYATALAFLSSDPDFDEFRRDFLSMARFAGVEAHDRCQMRNAFAAVGLGAPDQDCDGIVDPPPAGDQDGDGIGDTVDNCPLYPNPGQLNLDGDTLGDVCDADRDGDGTDNEDDVCPDVFDDQSDMDGDGVGDACEDSDADGTLDAVDNCPFDRNWDQSDIDGDGIGDVCDDDTDGDGIPDSRDVCPTRYDTLQQDGNGDGIGDVCQDRDGDGRLDVDDRCPDDWDRSDPDFDDDGLWDSCEDEDDDNDEVPDEEDTCRLVYDPSNLDTDEDGFGDVCDVCPEAENAFRDLDDDGLDDACDPVFDFRDPEFLLRCGLWSDFGECSGKGTSRREIEQTILAIQLEQLEKMPTFPIPVCFEDCPDFLPDGWTVALQSELEVPHELIVIDDLGHIVARSSEPGEHAEVTFRPTRGAHPTLSDRTYRAVVRTLEVEEPRAVNLRLAGEAGRW